jgi:hypothetical protein
MKQPSLKPEDGAEFFGQVEPIDNLVRARCYAKTAHQTEEPEFKMHANEDEALKWIGLRTRQRGFPNWRLSERPAPLPRARIGGAERDPGDRRRGPRPNSRGR